MEAAGPRKEHTTVIFRDAKLPSIYLLIAIDPSFFSPGQRNSSIQKATISQSLTYGENVDKGNPWTLSPKWDIYTIPCSKAQVTSQKCGVQHM